MAKKMGRPPAEGEKREKLVPFYLTQSDHELLKKAADKGKFKSTSSLITAMVEPVIQGGFSLRAAVQAISRVQKFMEGNGVKFSASFSELKDGMLKLFTPPPPIIPDQIEDLSQIIQDLRRLADELEKQTETKTPT